MSEAFNCENENYARTHAEKPLEKPIVRLTKMRHEDSGEVFRLAEECSLGFWSEIDYARESEREDSFSMLAKYQEETIGFITARLIMIRVVATDSACISTTDILQTSATLIAVDTVINMEIYNLAVKRNHRRAGIASKLITALFDYLRGLPGLTKNSSVWLEVRESNGTAIKFYLKHGFEFSYKRKCFYNNPPEDALILKAVVE